MKTVPTFDSKTFTITTRRRQSSVILYVESIAIRHNQGFWKISETRQYAWTAGLPGQAETRGHPYTLVATPASVRFIEGLGMSR